MECLESLVPGAGMTVDTAGENLTMDHSLHLAENLAAHNHEVEIDDIVQDVAVGYCNSKLLG